MNKFMIPPQCRLDRWVKRLCLIGASLALLYYLMVGVFVGFGVSILFVWLVLALLLAALAFCFPVLRMGWKKCRRFARSLLIGCTACVLIFSFTVAGSIFSGFFSDIPSGEAVDCLIILGAQVKPNAPSLSLARRIDAAYEYLAAHPDTIAIASGGQGVDEPISEAQCIYECLVEKGIAPNRILIEDRSTSTAENLQFSAALIPNNCQTVAIVTNNFHAFRGEATARKYLPNIDVYRLPADFHVFLLPHYLVRECAALVVDTLRGNLSFF